MIKNCIQRRRRPLIPISSLGGRFPARELRLRPFNNSPHYPHPLSSPLSPASQHCDINLLSRIT